MEKNQKIDLKIKINRGRYNLIFMVITSVINIFTISSGSSLTLPYSSSISNYAVAFGTGGNDILRIMGLVISCAVLLLILICYLLSKTKPMYLVISTAVIIADTLALLIISISSNTFNNLFVVLDFLIHILVIVYLVIAVKSYSTLLALGSDDDADKEQDIIRNTNSDTEIIDNDLIDEAEGDISEENEDKPIREYEDDSTPPLVCGSINGLNISAVIRGTTAELVINGYVCDELDITYESEYQLRAIVNNIDITFDYKRTYNGDAMYLYADNELLDSLGRN